ncbi:hypothetical protein DM01DRAFT_1336944 [Hesseltinella vesiculosa]|uniref:Homeobox domain-containing protein n=1 Tax=Hesseltinella vesiculosa TaxID=101127 RepID=A0A1X2GEK1_9FUNG|nr:hypothetical protein DM01DRAFT_1336944 [Hesseltinella vesiculosa]
MLSVNSMLNQVKDEPRPILPPLQPPSHHDHGLLKPGALNISSLLCPHKTPLLSPSSSPSPTDSLPAFSFPPLYQEMAAPLPHLLNKPAEYGYSRYGSGTSSPVLSPSLSTSSLSTSSSYQKDTSSKQKRGSLPSFPSLDEDPAYPSDTNAAEDKVKAKRRRANAKQLQILNQVFERTFFPSTQMRAELGRQLGMSPRTVQIWFQNKRQAMRTREKQRLLRMKDSDDA